MAPDFMANCVCSWDVVDVMYKCPDHLDVYLYYSMFRVELIPEEAVQEAICNQRH